MPDRTVRGSGAPQPAGRGLDLRRRRGPFLALDLPNAGSAGQSARRDLARHGRGARAPRRPVPAPPSGRDRGAARRAQDRRRLRADGPRLSRGTPALHDRRRPRRPVDHPPRPRRYRAGRRPPVVVGRRGPRRRALARGTGAARGFGRARPDDAGLRHLHLRLDRPTQGRGDRPWRRVGPDRLGDRLFQSRRRAVHAGLDLPQLRPLNL